MPISWQERVIRTENFHKNLLRANIKHTIRDTARILRRSFGSICEDLLLASWIKTHPDVEKFPTMIKALVYVRNKKNEMRTR